MHTGDYEYWESIAEQVLDEKDIIEILVVIKDVVVDFGMTGRNESSLLPLVGFLRQQIEKTEVEFSQKSSHLDPEGSFYESK